MSGEDLTELSSDVEDDLTWIEWFCEVERNEFFVEVDENYIRDDFNLTGLAPLVRHYDKALEVILDEINDDDEDVASLADDRAAASKNAAAAAPAGASDESPPQGRRRAAAGAGGGDSSESSDGPNSIMASAQTLYGLIHARYITTHRGMTAMGEKFAAMLFGTCPNAFCNNQPVVPIGLSDILGQCRTHVFCPRCNEVYIPRLNRLAAIDGAFFGTTFPHLFFLDNNFAPALGLNRTVQYYVPKISGFCIWRGVKDLLREEAAKVEANAANKAHRQKRWSATEVAALG